MVYIQYKHGEKDDEMKILISNSSKQPIYDQYMNKFVNRLKSR